MIYILYHKNCTDGFGAAYVAWNIFKEAAKYIEVDYYEPKPDIEKNSLIYVLDFCLDEETINKYKNKNCKIITIDHHIANKEKIKLSSEYLYSENESGALLTFNYFFHINKDKKHFEHNLSKEKISFIKKMVKYISDKDMNLFKLKKTKDIINGLESYPRSFDVWDHFDFEKLFKKGEIITEFKDNEIKILAQKSYFYIMDGQKIPVVNTSLYMCEVADYLLYLYPEAPFAATYKIYEKDGEIYRKWSLRSLNFDVNQVAKKNGGGGHKTIAAFEEKISFKNF